MLISTGDGSGRPDTLGVDRLKASDYAQSMFRAVVGVQFNACKALHQELNSQPEMYVVALDIFRGICAQRGIKSGRWREYCE